MKIKRTVYAPNLNMEMEFQLTPEEVREAYEEQQHEYDISDMENELDVASDDYIEEFHIDEEPVTEDELEEMARLLRKKLEADADACWSHARCEAAHEVLRKRNKKPRYVIGRPINGITINGLEYVQNDKGEEITFDSIEAAKEFLLGFDIGEAEIEAQGIQFEEVDA